MGRTARAGIGTDAIVIADDHFVGPLVDHSRVASAHFVPLRVGNSRDVVIEKVERELNAPVDKPVNKLSISPGYMLTIPPTLSA